MLSRVVTRWPREVRDALVDAFTMLTPAQMESLVCAKVGDVCRSERGTCRVLV
jgi:hypothetical protein